MGEMANLMWHPIITTGTKGLHYSRFHHYVRVMHNYHKSYTLDDSNGVSPSRGYKPVNFWWWKSHTISNLIRQAMNVSMQHNVTERPFGSNGVVVCIHVHLKTWISPNYWNFTLLVPSAHQWVWLELWFIKPLQPKIFPVNNTLSDHPNASQGITSGVFLHVTRQFFMGPSSLIL